MAGDLELASLERGLRGLLEGEFSSLSITFNDDHAPNYASAERYHDEWGQYADAKEWVSPEERDTALATNSVWTAQWYPQTPVGFCILRASSLTALCAALLKEPA